MNIGPLYIFLSIVCFVVAVIFIIGGILSKAASYERFFVLTTGTTILFVGVLYTLYEYVPPIATSIGSLVVILIAVSRKIIYEERNKEVK